ncbi:MAG: hypothetical protein HPY89_00770 [Pelotomaculum sp.]|nr:hypothetical protein [Pelotomaculum sp.]
MTANQLFHLAALRLGRDPEEIREIFSAVAGIILEKVCAGECVQAPPLAVFHPGRPAGPGRPRFLDARPIPAARRREMEVKMSCASQI